MLMIIFTTGKEKEKKQVNILEVGEETDEEEQIEIISCLKK